VQAAAATVPTTPTRRSLTLRRVVAVTVIGVGLAILLYPLVPLMRYSAFQPATPRLPYAVDLTPAEAAEFNVQPATAASNGVAKLPSGNRLVIPKIGVNMRILEGKNESVLWRGAWHIPGTSTPDKGGNTVISGHRWQYRAGSNTLYLADRVKKGDLMVVYWNGKARKYRVTETKLVNPDAGYIQAPSAKPRITVYTCAPLFSTKYRLVLIGEPI
jgi:LPXTG-site transpeptidase (sortase) family protein